MNVPIDFLKECFSYNAFSGQILWNERPKSHFSNEVVIRNSDLKDRATLYGALAVTSQNFLNVQKLRMNHSL